jgi:hypothetical protein
MKAFCLVCLKFSIQHWCLGYCREKNIYIKKPHRRCTKYMESSELTRPERAQFIIGWYQKASDLARERHRLISDFVKDDPHE